MKTIFKKFIIALLLIMILFNFTFSNCTPVYAGIKEDIEGIIGGIIGIFTWPNRLMAMALAFCLNILTAQVAYVDHATLTAQQDAVAKGKPINEDVITPFDIFFNNVQILDVNFLDINANGAAENTTTIRKQVAKWYTVVKLIAIAILLLILLYVGIRMAIASVASEKAVYKHALVDWIVSLCLVFVLQYIIMFTVQANNAIVSALKATCDAADIGKVMDDIAKLSLGISWLSIGSTVVYCIMVFQTLLFVIKYLKRMLTIGFLVIISPLISITYSIDKLGDGKAQALNSWLKEFVYNILIQPFHCILYASFASVAFTLLGGFDQIADGGGDAEKGLASAILAIVCILFIDTGEKIVRKIFGFENASSLSALGTAAAAGVALGAAQKAPELAQNARKGINMAKQRGAQLKNGVANMRNNMAVAAMMKKNPGMTREAAQQQVTDDRKKLKESKQKGNKPVKEMSRRQKARREDKIAKQMQRTMGAAAYARLVANQDTPQGKAAFDAAHAKAASQVDQRSDHRNRAIKTALGAPGKFVKGAGKAISTAKNVGSKVLNSDAGRWFRKSMAGGVGTALAAISLAQGNPMAAVGAYQMGSNFASEFGRTSPNNIVNEISDHYDKKSSDSDDCIDKLYTVKGNGDNGDYEENSSKTKECKGDLADVLRAMGIEQKLSHILAQIKRDMTKDPKKFDLGTSLSTVLKDKDKASDPDLLAAANKYANHVSDGMVYQQIQYAEQMGMDPIDLFNKIANRVDYAEPANVDPIQNASQEPANVDPIQNVSPESFTEPITETEQVHSTEEVPKGNSVVEHIERTENIETIINQIDQADVEAVKHSIDEKLQELRSIDLTGKTDDASRQIQMQIDRFEDASRRIQQRMDDNNFGGENN